MKSDIQLDKEAIIKRLLILDDELNNTLSVDEKIELIIVGSSAFILKGLLTRVTYDIDTYDFKQKQVIDVLERYDINNDATSVMNVCINYLERIQRINLEFKKIDVFVLGDYDLIISKMTTRPQDYDDIISSGLIYRIDFDLLGHYIENELTTPCNMENIWYNYRYLKNLASEGSDKHGIS